MPEWFLTSCGMVVHEVGGRNMDAGTSLESKEDQDALEVIFNLTKFRVKFLQAMLIWSERGRGSVCTQGCPKGGRNSLLRRDLITATMS